MTVNIDLQNVQNHLKLIMHAHNCGKRDGNNVCKVQYCQTIRDVLLHMTKCYDFNDCTYPDCRRSRIVINHWRNCTVHKCLICYPLRKASKMKYIIENLVDIFQMRNRISTSDQRSKIKTLATKIENHASNAAEDPDDYSNLVIDHVEKIRQACEKNRLSTKQENVSAISAPSDEIVETKVIESAKPDGSSSIKETSQSFPKHLEAFSLGDFCKKMTPILKHLSEQEKYIQFSPVTKANARDHCNTITNPMNFSIILTKLNANQYTTPFQFCEDVWLVYKYGVKPDDELMKQLDQIMKDYGYCCARQHVFFPSAMLCYGVNCTIPRDGDYFVYNNPDSSRNNLSNDKYTFCTKCFTSKKLKYILVGDDPTQTLVKIPKSEFQKAKNDHQEPEPMIDCTVCARRFHTICVFYYEPLWPQGYICPTCNSDRKENRNLARELPTTDLSNRLEKRVNDFLTKECGSDAGRVTIRVLAASDRVCEVKPKFKEHFDLQAHDGYPYRTKAIFAFQEIEKVDVILFGMLVQEYDSRCPQPNSKRVYISYIDSVHYFQPKNRRTEFYHEILIGYLEYAKELGFTHAHIWACPPNKGDDYIFYCHPETQLVPDPKKLQEWYKTMLDIAVQQRVIFDYKDIMKDCADSGVKTATDIPYFEGDFWASTMEDLIEKLDRKKPVKASGHSIEPEKPTKTSDKCKSGIPTTRRKNRSQRRIPRQNTTNRNDLFSKVYAMMKKHKESFFVVRLRNPMSNPSTLTDTDPLIQCDLMESRDAFLSFARDKHCEFSTIRRAKYSTMVSINELHSSTADKISYKCNACQQQCGARYDCTVCKVDNLCTKCYIRNKHEHHMERSEEANETTANSDTPVNIQQQRQLRMQQILEVIQCALQCRNVDCELCKGLIQHAKQCKTQPKDICVVCSRIDPLLCRHATTCTDQNCPLSCCASFKSKAQQKQATTMQTDRSGVKIEPGTATTTTAAQHHPSNLSQPMDTDSMES